MKQRDNLISSNILNAEYELIAAREDLKGKTTETDLLAARTYVRGAIQTLQRLDENWPE